MEKLNKHQHISVSFSRTRLSLQLPLLINSNNYSTHAKKIQTFHFHTFTQSHTQIYYSSPVHNTRYSSPDPSLTPLTPVSSIRSISAKTKEKTLLNATQPGCITRSRLILVMARVVCFRSRRRNSSPLFFFEFLATLGECSDGKEEEWHGSGCRRGEGWRVKHTCHVTAAC